MAVRSDRFCKVGAGLFDAFDTAYNLQRTNLGQGLRFREVMHGRIKMMTALCPAWALIPIRRCASNFILNNLDLKPPGFPSRKKLPCNLFVGLPPD